MIGIVSIAICLLMASQPALADNYFCGTIGVDAVWDENPTFESYDPYLNGSLYDAEEAQLVIWWDGDDDLLWNVWVNITNECGWTRDFKWTIRVDDVGAAQYKITGGDNSPRWNQDEYVTVDDLGHNGYDNTSLTIEVFDPLSTVTLVVRCQVWDNQIYKGSDAETWWYLDIE
jgi:hypothetical protein